MKRIVPESDFWREVGAGWNRLYGHFAELGISFEWHDFVAPPDFNWAKSFHPGSAELCLNLLGEGAVTCGKESISFDSNSAGFYAIGKTPLAATRQQGQRHQFITVEFAPHFLKSHLQHKIHVLNPAIRGILEGVDDYSRISKPLPMLPRQQLLVSSLRTPPALADSQALWFEAKAVELMVEFFFQPPEEKELFCKRHERTSLERVEKVKHILVTQMVEPPTLDEIARKVGCSSFYLSRTFSTVVGQTISQYLREVRMEKAADLLRSGKHNVTETAFAVGYSSLSHFSQAFHETYGCCPGLYPISTSLQRTRKQ